MSIVNIKHGKPVQTITEPTIYSPDFKHSIVDSKYTPSTSLLSNVEGVPTICEYYRQVLGGDEEQLGLQLEGLATYQSFTRIRNLILKLQDQEAFDFDDTKAESSAMVTAYALFDLAPILGDMFIMDIGDGRAGLFQVVEAPRIKSYAMDKVYEIDCKLLGVVTQDIFDKLSKRVVKELVYSKDSALNGGNALLTESDFELNKKLDMALFNIGRYFLSNCVWESENTIAIPCGVTITNEAGETVRYFDKVYDPYLTIFATNVIPLRTLGYNKVISRVDYSGAIPYGKNYQITVWDLFQKGDWSILPAIDKRMFIKDRRDFFGTRCSGTFFDTKFDGIIINDPIAFKDVNPPFFGYTYNGQFETHGTYPLPSYIFSDEFYKGSYGNEFEKLLLSVYRDNVIDKKIMLDECEKFYSYPLKLQVYYAPLLIGMIIKSKINNAGYL